MKEILHMLVVLSLICATSGAVLVNLKQATKNDIEQQVLTYVQGPALMSVLEGCDNDPIAERKKVGDVTVFPATRDGKLVGVALEAFAPGYSGDIGVIVGFDIENDVLMGIGITTQTETPGLGTKIMKPSFTKQFKAHGLKSMDTMHAAATSTPSPARPSHPSARWMRFARPLKSIRASSRNSPPCGRLHRETS